MKMGECESRSREREQQLGESGHVTFSLFFTRQWQWQAVTRDAPARNFSFTHLL